MIGFTWWTALAAWLGYGGWQVLRAWFGTRPTAGLQLAYFFNMCTAHVVCELVMLFTDGGQRSESETGFVISAWAVVGLVAGGLFADLAAGRPSRSVLQARPAVGDNWRSAALLAAGFGLAVFLSGRLFDLTAIPSLAVILGASNLLSAAGFFWLWWADWHDGRAIRGAAMLALSLMVPALTVLFSGFIGYGIAIVSLILASVVALARRKWSLFVIAGPALYLALTVYVTYMAGREEMRKSVWKMNDDIGLRMSIMQGQFASNATLFDPTDPRQLYAVDTRLNQNMFVGTTADRIATGLHELEYGQSYGNAFWAFIPRALWPDKPQISGGSAVVTRYTGIQFYGDTSVGEGHVLDWYANFGVPGLVVGMSLVGAMLTAIDRRAGAAIWDQSFDRFLPWYVAGATVCNGAVGRLSELPAGMAAAVLLATGYRLVARATQFNTRPSP